MFLRITSIVDDHCTNHYSIQCVQNLHKLSFRYLEFADSRYDQVVIHVNIWAFEHLKLFFKV